MKVYIINFENGKKYVGVSSNVFRRMVEHKKLNSAVGCAMRLHDWSFQIVFEGSREDCFQEEIRLIADLNTIAPMGYNLTSGGEGCVDLSSEAREKRSRNIKLAHGRPESRARFSEKASEMWKDQEFREQIVSGNLKTWSDKSLREKHSRIMREVQSRSEVKQAASLRAKKQWEDPEFRKRVSDLAKARWKAGVYK